MDYTVTGTGTGYGTGYETPHLLQNEVSFPVCSRLLPASLQHALGKVPTSKGAYLMRKLRMMFWVVLLAAALAILMATPAFAGGISPGSQVSGFRWYVSTIDGSYQPYGVYFPKNYSASNPPGVVLYAMHGFGGSATGSFGSTQKTWADNNNAILLSLRIVATRTTTLLARSTSSKP